MFLRCAAALCVYLCVPDAVACTLKSGVSEFKPQLTETSASADELKAPGLELVSITRGVGTRHSSCDDTGLLSIRVEWPRGTDYKLRDIGFEFRVVSGETSYQIFPQGVVSSRVDGRGSEFLFMWRDGPPGEQQPINMQVEVRAVTADNRRGPPTRLSVSAMPGS